MRRPAGRSFSRDSGILRRVFAVQDSALFCVTENGTQEPLELFECLPAQFVFLAQSVFLVNRSEDVCRIDAAEVAEVDASKPRLQSHRESKVRPPALDFLTPLVSC